MKSSLDNIVKLTFLAVIVYLVVRNWRGAASFLRAGGEAYGKGVNSLQGHTVYGRGAARAF
jgi:hypothetical protein